LALLVNGIPLVVTDTTRRSDRPSVGSILRPTAFFTKAKPIDNVHNVPVVKWPAAPVPLPGAFVQNRRADVALAAVIAWQVSRHHFFTCPETNFVISNMLTCFFPLNTAFRFSSALMRVLFFASCNPFLRM
jgi:hypothetical protein